MLWMLPTRSVHESVDSFRRAHNIVNPRLVSFKSFPFAYPTLAHFVVPDMIIGSEWEGVGG